MNPRALCKCLCALLLVSALPLLQAADATLLKKSGSVTMSPKGGGADQELKVGDTIPDGATVKTGPGAEAHLQPMAGAVATLKGEASVVVGGDPKATLSLKSGTLVSTIDPSKKLNYTVRTPRGLAAAKGTAFSVSITAAGFSIAATADQVVFTPPSGGTFVIAAGMVSITPPGATTPNPPVPLAQVAQTNPEIASVVQSAVQTIATVVQNNLGNLSSDSATQLASQVVAAASAALPNEAAGFTGQVVAAMTASTAPTAGTAANAVAAVTASAAQAAPNQAAQVAASAAQAAPNQAAAAVAAATQVAPQSQQQIVQQVAQSTGQSAASVQQQATQVAASVANTVSQTVQTNQAIVAPPAAPPTPPAPPPAPPPPPPPTTPVIDPGIRPTSPSS